MGILESLEEKARKRHPRIAIGAGSQRAGYVEKVERSARSVDFADVEVVGEGVQDPELELIRLLKSGRVDAAIRGSLSASKTLSAVKTEFRPDWIGRVALLQDFNRRFFLFSPVGVDEGNSVEEKMFLAKGGIALAKKIGFKPRICVLSGGRKGDVGRHKKVDASLEEAEKLARWIKEKECMNTKNYNILVEDALADMANILIAPDGITGNLMFRTLVYLGGGRAIGAPLLGIEKVFVDTSRAGNEDDYRAAITLAAALAT